MARSFEAFGAGSTGARNESEAPSSAPAPIPGTDGEKYHPVTGQALPRDTSHEDWKGLQGYVDPASIPARTVSSRVPEPGEHQLRTDPRGRPMLTHHAVNAYGEDTPLTPKQKLENQYAEKRQAEWDSVERSSRPASRGRAERAPRVTAPRRATEEEIVSGGGGPRLRDVTRQAEEHLTLLTTHWDTKRASLPDGGSSIADKVESLRDAAQTHILASHKARRGEKMADGKVYPNESLAREHNAKATSAINSMHRVLTEGSLGDVNTAGTSTATELGSAIASNHAFANAHLKLGVGGGSGSGFQSRGAKPKRVRVAGQVLPIGPDGGHLGVEVASGLNRIKKAADAGDYTDAGVDEETAVRVRAALTGTPRRRKAERDALAARGEGVNERRAGDIKNPMASNTLEGFGRTAMGKTFSAAQEVGKPEAVLGELDRRAEKGAKGSKGSAADAVLRTAPDKGIPVRTGRPKEAQEAAQMRVRESVRASEPNIPEDKKIPSIIKTAAADKRRKGFSYDATDEQKKAAIKKKATAAKKRAAAKAPAPKTAVTSEALDTLSKMRKKGGK